LTRDVKGHRAFCMTLQTREQHIRREKAMSNNVTNESLLAVAAATFLAVQGSNGLRRLAAENIRRAKERAASIDKTPGFTAPVFTGAHFNDFVVRYKGDYSAVHRGLLTRGVHGDMPLVRRQPELSDAARSSTAERRQAADVN